MLAVSYVLGASPSWLGKQELFRGTFGRLMRWLGGLPVDRSTRTGVVDQAIARLNETDDLFLVVPPSGTRSRATHWKSGFYHIANGAQVPLLCAYLDYARRAGGIGLVFTPTGDLRADMDRIRAFYADKRGKFPDQATPIRLLEEDPPTRALGGR